MSDKKSKAELFQMLAEAVRNTQPRPVSTQPEPIQSGSARWSWRGCVRVHQYAEAAMIEHQPGYQG
jgi:hypothetical protein